MPEDIPVTLTTLYVGAFVAAVVGGIVMRALRAVAS